MNELIVKKGAGLQPSSLLSKTQPYAWRLKITIQEDGIMLPIDQKEPQNVGHVNAEITGFSEGSPFTVVFEVRVPERKNAGENAEKIDYIKEDIPVVCTRWERLIHRQRASAATKGRENQCDCCKNILRPDGICPECGACRSC